MATSVLLLKLRCRRRTQERMLAHGSYLRVALSGAHIFEEAEPMQEWEYSTINLNEVPRRTDDIDVLNDAGKEGWELVTITTNNIAFLKRLIDEPARAPATRRKAAAVRVQEG